MVAFNRLAAVAVASLGMAVMGQATVFSNITYGPGPLNAGITSTPLGNSISFFLPNAAVGDGLPSNSGVVQIQYDASGPAAFGADIVGVNSTSLDAILGNGTIAFTEQIFKLDGFGNEVGGPIGSWSTVWDANSPLSAFSHAITFSQAATNIRAKKTFTLTAGSSEDGREEDGGGPNLAALSIVNQNLTPVPEPASIAVIGMGLAGLLRRRVKR